MKHLLDIESLQKDDVDAILERGDHWANRPGQRSDILKECFIAHLFLEPSTRTRFSFEVAAKRLGADILHFSESSSSKTKGESLYDTVRTLEAMGVEAVVIRHGEDGVLKSLADRVNVHLINAGEGRSGHPTQSLLDLLTIQQHFGRIEGLKVAIIGDLLHSRVARSDMQALEMFGAEILLGGPDEMMIPPENLPSNASVRSVDDAVAQADVVMMLRVQRERHAGTLYAQPSAYHQVYGLTRQRAQRMRDHAVIMHPAPVNRGVEIDSDLVESERSLIQKQVENGVAVRMSVLENAVQGGDLTWASYLKMVNA